MGTIFKNVLLEKDTGGAQIIKNGLPWQPVSKY